MGWARKFSSETPLKKLNWSTTIGFSFKTLCIWPAQNPEKSRDFIFKNPGIFINLKSRDPGIPGIPLRPGPQMAWPRRCKVTQVAVVRLFPIVLFQRSPQIACPRECIFALVAFFGFSPLCLVKLFDWKDARSHALHLVGFSPVCFQMCL